MSDTQNNKSNESKASDLKSDLGNFLHEAGEQLKPWLEDIKSSEKPKEWAKQATEFIQKNPWAAVAGAALAGYAIAHMTQSKRDSRS